MHALSPALCALALISVSGPALALDSWTATTERGLPVLSLTQGEGSVRIVCDPDRVFGPTPNGAVIVALPRDKAPTTVVFLAKSGEQARLAIVNGAAAQAKADAAEWASMIEILRRGGEFAVVSSQDSLSFETAPLPDLACE
ncbi:hypothetical protein SAMN04488103_1194 [Gemmobacter aquatilis]|uniref:Uncharacterized protein n=2 Tax=Gemmobacter aquatilis TaxID=933059 RepID=A0A1H8NFA3_9RHOB|nr:hypothetical protein SAMN04488103_1194 [Gemmobacter aquatilis]